MKKLFALLLILTLVLTSISLTACGGNGGEADSDPADWNYVLDNGVLIVGLDDTFAPMGFRDEKGDLVGFDIDLATAVGEYLGIEITFKPIDWDAKGMELSSKRIDCIWNGMSATPERQENMTLTDKYLNNRIVLMSLDPQVKVTSVEDLANYKIATQADSAALEVMMDNDDYDLFKDNISELLTYDEAILEMMGKRADLMVVDEVLGEYKNKNMDGAMFLLDFDFGDDFYAIGCRRGDTELANKLNEALAALIEDGTTAEISNKWFGRNIVILEGYDK